MTRSWVPGADGSGFGLENLPLGAVVHGGGRPQLAARVGEHALLLGPLADAGLLEDPAGALRTERLNPLLALGRPAWSALRSRLTALLSEGAPEAERAGAALVPLAGCHPVLPLAVGDYVDFYSSLEHATNLGRMFRPEAEPLLPNWRELPVGYHGRASTVVVSGTPVRRPHGQLPPGEPGGRPRLAPSERLDIELELGFVTGGPGNPLGTPIRAAEAGEHVFGFVLVNDWSARDIQRWEYVPLGPFLGKSFATSVSPWIVPLEALEPYRVAGPPQEPAPLPYLRTEDGWAVDLALEVALAPAGDEETVVSRTNARGLYWSVPQQLAHATVNGTAIRAGDLYASGTISGAEPGSFGSLIELTWGGRDPLTLAGGQERTFLADGDTVVLRGATPDGRVSLGEVRGRVLPALA